MGWSDISDEKRDELLQRRKDGENIVDLAYEVDMPAMTLDRRLREWRQSKKIDDGKPLPKIEIPKEKPLPDNNELYQILRSNPVSLKDLSNRLDRSEDTVLKLLDRMEQAGYALTRDSNFVEISTSPSSHKPQISTPLADDVGHMISFAVASDIHAGSRCSQPSSLNHFLQLAVEEYEVRYVFVPGDVTTGLYGYRGHEYDLIPGARPMDKKEAYTATDFQVSLASYYLPDDLGLKYYLLGGNHDWWHVTYAGIDAVARLARQRDDCFFLGYDAADVPLTDRISVRMWHPSGGVPYALSYRLQKNVEQTAFEELVKLIDDDMPPKVRFIFSGHLHVECKFQRGPLTATQCGCFEGQTNYLKRKGLFPSIGGQIWRVWITDNGQVNRVEYTFCPYAEVIDDWKNWPIPEMESISGEPDNVGVLFSLKV